MKLKINAKYNPPFKKGDPPPLKEEWETWGINAWGVHAMDLIRETLDETDIGILDKEEWIY